MAKTISKVISYAFHPTLAPLVGVYLLLNTTHLVLLPQEGKNAIIKIVSMATLILPLMMLPILYYQKRITDITVSERNQRLLPISIAILFYFFAYYILRRLGVPGVIQYYILASFICVLLAGLINLKWKISLHMIGVGGLIGLLSAMSYLLQVPIQYLLMASILVAGLIGSARIYLKEHDHIQIYSGFLLGFVITFCIIVGMSFA